MLAIQVKTNVDQFLKQIENVRVDQIPYAMSLAMNWSIEKAEQGVKAEMERVFDRPTPYTLGGVYSQRASKRFLVATVYLKDGKRAGVPIANSRGTPAAEYLRPQIESGARNPKGLEVRLRAAGLLPAGMFAVPVNAPRDGYGNVRGGFIIKMLSDMQTWRGDSSGLNRKAGRRSGKKAEKAFFIPKPGSHLKAGIYQRQPGRGLSLMFAFTSSPNYRARFDFHGVASRIAMSEFPKQFPEAWRQAMATARPGPVQLKRAA